MTWKWLATRTGAVQLAERVALLERQLAERVVPLERQLAEMHHLAQVAAERSEAADRQARALRRAMRSGANRLNLLLADSATEEARQEEIARLSATIAFLERRIEDEAEQARRGIAGLFDQLREGRSTAADQGHESNDLR